MKSPVTIWRKQKRDTPILGRKGKIVTWTKIMVAPPKFQAFTPYVVVLVELENKEKVYGQLVDFEEKDPVSLPGHADYQLVKQMKGFAYYVVEHEGKPALVKNKLYKEIKKEDLGGLLVMK